MENILRVGNTTIVFNGGDPLEGCPKDFEEANGWADEANKNKGEEGEVPWWSFDCGFKLDFDGPLVEVSSRFYPPTTHYGPKWDGTVTIFVLGKRFIEQEFECDSLDELREQVESYVNSLNPRLSLGD